MRNLRIAELLFNQPLMISEAKLNVILHAIGPRFNLDMAALPAEQTAVISDQDRRRAGYQVVDGCAIIGIHGPLLHRLLASEYPSGGPTTYADIRRAFDTALSDEGVNSIVLDIDSPGGMVSGAFDLADHIFQSRSVKPITAIVNEGAFSSGYTAGTGGTGTAGPPRQGYDGGSGLSNGAYAAAGGGGAGGAGGQATNSGATSNGGNGGIGVSSSKSGSAVTYAVGGGGGASGANRAGTGAGGTATTAGAGRSVSGGTGPVAGQTNRGDGGGGGYNSTGAAGGSGIVIIRYPV